MKKEDLITKWLSNEQLTKHETEAFKELDVSDSYIKISETAKKFKAPEYNPEENFQDLKDKLQSRNTMKSLSYTKILMQVAAVFAIGIGVYFSFFKDYDTHISTLATKKTTVELPDSSIVKLNSVSSISYNQDNWESNRKVNLEGEAFFKVATGKKFDIHTSKAVISVIGTIFNIKQRKEYLEVICYSGVVSVSYNTDQIKYLREGDRLEIHNGKVIKHNIGAIQEPQWFTNRSLFYATTYDKVLQEFEWQYGVTITTKNIDKNILFTGNFTHTDIENALKSITIPMRLKYKIGDKNITLYNKD